MELSGTSEAARESFTRAICLLSECHATPSPGSKAVAEASTVTRIAAEVTTNQKRLSSEDQKGQGETHGDGRSVGKSVGGAQSESLPAVPNAAPGSATIGPRVDEVQTSSSALNAGGSRNIEGDIAPAGTDNQISPPSSGAEKATPSADGGAQVPTSTPKDKAMAALAAVMRGLESRFVAQQSPPSAATPVTSGVHVATSMANATTGSEGERGEFLARSCGRGVDGGSPVSPPAEYGGWSAWIRPTRAEEILADLLEREKGRFAHVNRDGARAIEKWTAADGRVLSTPPMYFISQAMAVSSVPTVVTAATTAVSSVKTAPSQRNSGGSSGKPSGTSRALTRAPKASTTAPRPNTKVDIRRQQQRHYPISLSAPGLGENASIFSMMLRGAALLDRHELAVLLAVRCADHFLDASDVLMSPRGPLGIAGRRSRPPGKGGGRGGGIGNEGLGAVHLLLTTRDTGNDRRVVDTALKSACAEFLVHALTVALWAVPYATRVELFGLSTGGIGSEDVGHSHGSGTELEHRAAVRRRSVLRCLSRLLKHSVDSENTRVRTEMISFGSSLACRAELYILKNLVWALFDFGASTNLGSPRCPDLSKIIIFLCRYFNENKPCPCLCIYVSHPTWLPCAEGAQPCRLRVASDRGRCTVNAHDFSRAEHPAANGGDSRTVGRRYGCPSSRRRSETSSVECHGDRWRCLPVSRFRRISIARLC